MVSDVSPCAVDLTTTVNLGASLRHRHQVIAQRILSGGSPKQPAVSYTGGNRASEISQPASAEKAQATELSSATDRLKATGEFLTSWWLLGTVAVLIGVLSIAFNHWRKSQTIEFESHPPLDYQFELDINEASERELSLLPGLGPKLSKRILESRQMDGDYRSLEELERVRGIGRSRRLQLQAYLYVDQHESNEQMTIVASP